jgi:hypothetical protein
MPGALAKRRWTAVLLTKELLISMVDAPDDMLDGLGIKLLPVGKPCHTLELRDMALQSVITGVAFEPLIIALL